MQSSNDQRSYSGREFCEGMLQKLRRQAGYRSAKDFAEALGVPNSTYSRYERAAAGPDCGIPLSAAWVIADELGCSIDLVVGREGMDECQNHTIGARINKLTCDDRKMLEGFLGIWNLESLPVPASRCEGFRIAGHVAAMPDGLPRHAPRQSDLRQHAGASWANAGCLVWPVCSSLLERFISGLTNKKKGTIFVPFFV